jgi:hypothetical protein
MRSCRRQFQQTDRHNCLRFVWSEPLHERWRFTLPAGDRTVAASGNRISDDADAVRRRAVAAEGLIYKSRLDLMPDLMQVAWPRSSRRRMANRRPCILSAHTGRG